MATDKTRFSRVFYYLKENKMKKIPTSTIGLGANKASLHVYIENIPPLEQYQMLNNITAMERGEIAQIATLTGNHWRKIFNVFAKLCFELKPLEYPTWQQYRDNELLQQHSEQCLYFSPFHMDNNLAEGKAVHIIMGRTYAKKQGLSEQCHWINEDFAVNKSQGLIICPYFDYRQLSNIKISQLVKLITQLNC